MKNNYRLTAEELRKSILQLAIQGKLVKQNPNDEPASVLVEKIYEEKRRLISEGKIKKDKQESYIFKGDDNCYYEKVGNNAPVKLDDLPFDIPENWTWIRLNNLMYIQTGASFKKDQAVKETKEGFVRVLRGGNICPFKYLLKSDDLYIPEDLVSSNILLQRNDLITPAVTSLENIGKIAVIDIDLNKVTSGGFVYIFRPYLNNSIISSLIADFVSSSWYQSIMKGITKKSGQAFYNMNKEKLLQLYFPIPPLNEQQRIVEKIDFLSPYINEYEKIESELYELDSTIKDKLKKSILQYAIEGKLVKQDPNDEPASVLLERIKAEKEKLIKEGKIKRDKNESYIYQGDDKNYYENLKLNWPISWVVQPLKNVLLPMESCKPNGESFEYIDIESIDNKSNCIASSKTIKSSDAPSRATRKLSDGDVLFSIVRPYLKNIAIVSKSFAKCIGSTGFYVCKPIKLLKTQFLYYFLLSPYCIDGIMPFMKGDNSPSIRGTDLERLYIGFPAFNEQEKIVKKIIYLFEKIDNQSY